MKIKKYITTIFFVLFLLVIFVGTILTMHVEKISYKESRALPTMPAFSLNSFISKEFTYEFDTFIDCNFYLREMFLEIACFIDKNVLLKTGVNDVYVIDGQLVSPVYEQNAQWLEERADLLNRLIEQTDDTEFYFFLLPKKAELLSEELSKLGANDYSIQNKEVFIDALDDDVKVYNLADYYREIGDIETLFYRTDHHNNLVGAYFSYVYMIDTIKQDFPSVGQPLQLEDFEITKVSDNFCGSRGRLLGRLNVGKLDEIYKFSNPVLENEIEIEYDGRIYTSPFFPSQLRTEPDQDFYLKQFTYYMGGNFDIMKATNNAAPNDLDLLIFKDSFMLPIDIFLLNHFKTTTIIDLRHYEGDEITKLIESSDVVIFGYSDLDSFNTYRFH